MKEEFVLTQETFLRVLGLSEIENGLRSPDDRHALYTAAIELVRQSRIMVESPDWTPASTSLDLRVPGTSIIIRLSRWQKEELTGAITAAAMVIGMAQSDPKTLTAAGVLALATRVSRLRAEYGERSIIEVLPSPARPTAAAITLLLHGNPCRHPESGCRFRAADGRHCAISREQVKETANLLVERGVLRVKNAVEPHEYAIVF
ncbi:hypothetical protein GCM10029978_110300 [Actinoallomurus acanthiterrae]